MKEKPPTVGNIAPEQLLAAEIAAAVGEDGSILEMIALVIRPGRWPTVTLRKRLRPPELEAAVKVFQRHHIIGIEIRSQTLGSGHQEPESGGLEPGLVQRHTEQKESKR